MYAVDDESLANKLSETKYKERFFTCIPPIRNNYPNAMPAATISLASTNSSIPTLSHLDSRLFVLLYRL